MCQIEKNEDRTNKFRGPRHIAWSVKKIPPGAGSQNRLYYFLLLIGAGAAVLAVKVK